MTTGMPKDPAVSTRLPTIKTKPTNHQPTRFSICLFQKPSEVKMEKRQSHGNEYFEQQQSII